MSDSGQKEAGKDDASRNLPFPETDLSPALQRTIKEKIDRGELDEVDVAKFIENLRQAVRKDK